MPMQDYGRYMGSMADTVQAPVNAFYAARDNAMQNQRRDAIVQTGQNRLAFEQQQAQQEQQAAQAGVADKQRVAAELWKIDSHLKSGDPKASLMRDPEAVQRMQQQGLDLNAMSPQEVSQRLQDAAGQLMAHLGQLPKEAEKAPGPISYQKTPWGGQLAMQDGKKIADYNPPAPQQYGPESFSPFTQADGSVVLIGNRGSQRPTNITGPTKAASGSGVSVGPDGQLTVDSASIKASEGERKVAALGVRLEAALRNLENIRTRNPGSDRPTYEEVAKGSVPFVGEMWANKARSPDRQQADAAQTDALDAALTLATGAAYTKEQFSGLKKSYFPQIGDSPETIAFKEQQFNNIVQAARVNAGRAEPTINAALTASGQSAAARQNPQVQAALNPKEGQTGKSKSGKDIIFRNGQWEYK